MWARQGQNGRKNDIANTYVIYVIFFSLSFYETMMKTRKALKTSLKLIISYDNSVSPCMTVSVHF